MQLIELKVVREGSPGEPVLVNFSTFSVVERMDGFTRLTTSTGKFLDVIETLADIQRLAGSSVTEVRYDIPACMYKDESAIHRWPTRFGAGTRCLCGKASL